MPFKLAGNSTLGLLRVDTTRTCTELVDVGDERLCNMWMSSYVLSPHGARLMLEYFRSHPIDPDYEHGELDQALGLALPSLGGKHDEFAMYVVNETNRYFVHGNEVDSDKRSRDGDAHASAVFDTESLLSDDEDWP